MNQGRDLSVETLLDVAERLKPEVPRELLLRLYSIQKSYQFDDNREIAVQETRRVLEEFIAERAKIGEQS
ncbi:DNA modification system-associated small protein [Luteimonas yanweni]